MTDSAQPLDAALKFLAEDLLRLVDRLGAYGTDGVKDDAKRLAAKPNLLRLRTRVQEIGETLLAMDQDAWGDAAVRYKDGSEEWRVTCDERAASVDAANGARRCGEHLSRAANHISELAEAESAAMAAKIARRAATELTKAAFAWNEASDQD
ncbi:MAG: hypothetical protein K8T90_06985 [Planctomycetes bacterium]|nr:hypothetical protein [Planctomycetota bacterium]